MSQKSTVISIYGQATGTTCHIRLSQACNALQRHEIAEEQIAAITRLHGAFEQGEQVKIFDNADFGYRRITVERPLRLNFAVDDERLARVQETSQFANLATSKKRKDKAAAEAEMAAGRRQQQAILDALRPLAGHGLVKNRERFSALLTEAFMQAGVAVPAALFKAILLALGERDETADLCTTKKGKPEPDPDLRDYENVPLKESVKEYMAREVLPHVPDAWVDRSKTKIGYEINFNRYFYQYTPPRPLDVIEADLKAIEAEIAELLAEVTA
jgi:type I restriction enzyme M protein